MAANCSTDCKVWEMEDGPSFSKRIWCLSRGACDCSPETPTVVCPSWFTVPFRTSSVKRETCNEQIGPYPLSLYAHSYIFCVTLGHWNLQPVLSVSNSTYYELSEEQRPSFSKRTRFPDRVFSCSCGRCPETPTETFISLLHEPRTLGSSSR